MWTKNNARVRAPRSCTTLMQMHFASAYSLVDTKMSTSRLLFVVLLGLACASADIIDCPEEISLQCHVISLCFPRCAALFVHTASSHVDKLSCVSRCSQIVGTTTRPPSIRAFARRAR